MSETTTQLKLRLWSNRLNILVLTLFVALLVAEFRQTQYNKRMLSELEEEKKSLLDIRDSISHLVQLADDADHKTIKALDLIIESTNNDKE